MNHALSPVPSITSRPAARRSTSGDESARLKRLRSLLALLSLYAGALLVVVVLSNGADVGCILAGISGHVLYATYRIVTAWRDASWLEHARERILARRCIA
jgi:hypothetical protein